MHAAAIIFSAGAPLNGRIGSGTRGVTVKTTTKGSKGSKINHNRVVFNSIEFICASMGRQSTRLRPIIQQAPLFEVAAGSGTRRALAAAPSD